MTDKQNLEPSLSALIISIASASAMNMGLAPNPSTGKTEKNLEIAKYNLELIKIIEKKTASHLDEEESKLIKTVISDLQVHYVNANKT